MVENQESAVKEIQNLEVEVEVKVENKREKNEETDNTFHIVVDCWQRIRC